MKKLFLCFALILIIFPLVSAGSVSFSVEQKEYYFQVGQNAIINLTIDNSYSGDIAGILTYSISQISSVTGQSTSSVNSRTVNFNTPAGENIVSLNFGASNSPAELDLSLYFKFEYDNDEKKIEMDDIFIFFVEKPEEKQNQQDEQKSKSESTKSMTEKMKEKMSEMLNKEQKPDTQQKISQNQENQDTSALRDQMRNQANKKEAEKNEFRNKLAENEDFQKENTKMQEKGYKPVSDEMNQDDKENGEFKVDYENNKGEEASISGDIENGSVSNMTSETEGDAELEKQLSENKDFKKFEEKLKNQGFEKMNQSFRTKENKTVGEYNYKNEKNETATIESNFEDRKLKGVVLEKDSWFSYKFFIYLLFAFALAGLGYYYYKKYYLKAPVIEELVTERIVKPFNYRVYSKKLLRKSEREFEAKNYKEAYTLANKSIRLFLIHKHGFNKEMTNDEIVRGVGENGKQELKKAFDICSLVEFAKYKPNRKDFSGVIKFGEKLFR